jgi:hypothetical protein
MIKQIIDLLSWDEAKRQVKRVKESKAYKNG